VGLRGAWSREDNRLLGDHHERRRRRYVTFGLPSFSDPRLATVHGGGGGEMFSRLHPETLRERTDYSRGRVRITFYVTRHAHNYTQTTSETVQLFIKR
jgi:hypothetical protein